MRIKYEVSAGGLVLRRRESAYDALLIGRGTPRIWTLPKGHVEAKESHEQAALREVREETGCWGEIVAKLNDIAYWFYFNHLKHKKSVTFYLMRYLSGDTANHDHEVDEARWFDIATVPLALVAEQYLAYISMMENLDVEVAAEYLVIAATLVFLKSRALLPPIPAEFLEEGESPEEVEERLRQRLIAYSKYREVG